MIDHLRSDGAEQASEIWVKPPEIRNLDHLTLGCTSALHSVSSSSSAFLSSAFTISGNSERWQTNLRRRTETGTRTGSRPSEDFTVTQIRVIQKVFFSLKKETIVIRRGAQLKFHGGPKNFFVMFKDQNLNVLHVKKTMKETINKSKMLDFVDQIKSLRGPHLARGPYVVHAV
jgi:hypothetical protein